ncbi:Lysine-specific demethylase 8 [Trichoplax sp. H2]|uniref:JmjC domain-containing protein n=1 Tax=Trichoplax adhaerens TaxID=10228 RepID=B3RX21_TRIAD|nr:hypothetical protein TRIADDRAFT_63974 [Trichoplax adhaerens]EDV25232.1 hypothetical protein TRIADDRAFT_63974 [Trichoplax adhaerens]RDD43631.1 Lysine-specific demethylase 8 [Trichoplax sp. H2]|eukprot:XP_002113122.1 hypothetical protein TRIADDRAFT_63974 [Trichoplax adhaerens]
MAVSWIICSLLVVAYQVDADMKGHLQPLGQAGPLIESAQVDGFPSMKTFFNEYVWKSVPLVMKGAAKTFPAFQSWTDEYFLSFPETANWSMFVEKRKKEIRNLGGEDATFKEFLLRYNQTDEYLIANVPQYLKKDIHLPSVLACDVIKYVDEVMWFSSGGTKSVLHNDDVDNVNCLIRGKKELIFINKKYEKEVAIDHEEGSYSGVDVDKVDLNKYPGLGKVDYQVARMEAGDCLFIPYHWYHHVRSYDSNIAVNVWFQHYEKPIDLSSCPANPQPKGLDNFVFETEANENTQSESGDISSMKGYILDTLGDVKKSDLKGFIDLMKEDNENWKWKGDASDDEIITKMFKEVDTNNDGEINIQEANQISKAVDKTLNDLVASISVPISGREGGPPEDDNENVDFEYVEDDNEQRDEL